MASELDKLTHVDASGRARMVDVSGKEITARRARARAVVELAAHADELLREGRLPKGHALEVVRFAAIQAAKRTAELLPLCHPLRITQIDAQLSRLGPAGSPESVRWEVVAEVAAVDRTGVEMEALTAAAVGALALYDMVKAVDRSARVVEVALQEKSGGKSGDWRRSSRAGE